MYTRFSREEWAELRLNTPLHLSDADLERLRGINQQVPLAEVSESYLPLSRLLNLHVSAARNLWQVQDAFLGDHPVHAPYILAIAGSVAAGKSTFSRVLQAVLSRWPHHPRVELVTTDGFLYPNKILMERGLMRRKGFPESYDQKAIVDFLAAIKAGENGVRMPVYSHETYDIRPNEFREIEHPDILIFEGLNVLQIPKGTEIVCSDFFDFSVFLDADETDLEKWYLERVMLLQRTAFQKSESFFYEYRHMSQEQTREWALKIWREINLVNLRENILPTRQRASVVWRKCSDHTLRELWLRKT
jgi:type I pantothenate kinase